MKKIKYYFAILLVAFVVFSCYEDKTTFGTVTNSLVIDTAGWNLAGGVVYTSIGKTITLNPDVSRADGSSNDLEYEWILPLLPGNVSNKFGSIGKEKKLEYLVRREPSVNNYHLLFIVTDKKAGLKATMSFPMSVSSPFGDGLVVADSRDNGATSDISFVKNQFVTRNYVAASHYERNMYSVANSKPITGKVSTILYNEYKSGGLNQYYLNILSEHGLERLLTTSYGIDAEFSQLFSSTPPANTTEMCIAISGGAFIFVCGEDIYVAANQSSNGKQIFNDPTNYKIPAQIANKIYPNKYLIGNSGGNASFFDPTRHEFYIMSGFMGQFSIVPVEKGAVVGAFEPKGYQGYEQIASVKGVMYGESSETYDYHILKAPNGEVGIYGIQSRYIKEEERWSYETMELKNAKSVPEIGDATFFDCNMNRNILYYATDKKVYAAIISSTMSGSLVFTAPSDETITCVSMYREAWSNNYYELPEELGQAIPTHDNMLMIATCDGAGNGKVYLLDITGNSGTLGQVTSERTLTGFGRISALAVQGAQ